MKKGARVFVMFLCGILSFGGMASLTYAVGGVGGAPLNPLNPDHKGWFMYQLGAGESYEDVFVVKNTTNQDWLVEVYPADQIPSSSGGFALKQKVEKMEAMGVWIKMATNEILLKAGQAKKIPFTISIPQDAIPGEVAGAIMMEKKSPEEKEKPTFSGGTGVRISLRTGTRVYNTIPGNVVEELTLLEGSSAKLKVKDVTRKECFKKMSSITKLRCFLPREGIKSYAFSHKIKSAGNISTQVKFETIAKDISGDEGEVIFDNSEKPPIFRVSPGATFDYNGAIPNLPKYGEIELVSKVSMIDRNGVETFLGERTFSTMTYPKNDILSVVLATVSGVILLTLFSVYRKIKYSGKGWVVQKVKAGETITEIAKEHNIDWEFLAKVNGIGQPYILNKGDKLRVPPKK